MANKNNAQTNPQTKKIRVQLPTNYNPTIARREWKDIYDERFFRLFASTLDFEGVTPEERYAILKRLWEDGSMSVSRSPAPVEMFEKEMDLTFTQYAVDDYDYNLEPLHYHNVSVKGARAISTAQLKVGDNGVIVYLNAFARRKRKSGAMAVAKRYIRQIVNIRMAINTNVLLHKIPYMVACSELDVPAYKDALRQIFEDNPAVFVPKSMQADFPQSVQLSVPYVIDKLDSYIVRLENMYLDEIGIDNSKPIAPGQDRLLMDEANANNALINCFSSDMVDSLNEGFEEVERIFGRRIRAKRKSVPVASVHEDINGKGEKEDEED